MRGVLPVRQDLALRPKACLSDEAGLEEDAGEHRHEQDEGAPGDEENRRHSPKQQDRDLL